MRKRHGFQRAGKLTRDFKARRVAEGEDPVVDEVGDEEKNRILDGVHFVLTPNNLFQFFWRLLFTESTTIRDSVTPFCPMHIKNITTNADATRMLCRLQLSIPIGGILRNGIVWAEGSHTLFAEFLFGLLPIIRLQPFSRMCLIFIFP